MDRMRLDEQMDESVMREKLKALRMKNIADVLEEVEVSLTCTSSIGFLRRSPPGFTGMSSRTKA